MRLSTFKTSRTALSLIAAGSLATILGVYAANDSGTDNKSGSSITTVCADKLPTEAHETIELIAKGGPYPHKQDGTVFKNKEGVLPDEQSGYYHEFTVETPGLDHRGAKRVVTGGDISDKVEDYYSDDHYRSFKLIDYSCNGKGETPDPNHSPQEGDQSLPPTGTGGATAKPPAGTDTSKVSVMCFKDTNEETKQTLDLIWKHADDRSKFPYPKKDGSTFEWRENDKYPFPRKEDGYYKEWTVPTPGAENRAKQRIVTGGDPSDKVEDYYTDDHYKTFALIDYGC